ncbi:prepilin-type N-terminal cleavage/methylation domain-containing protein [Acinetobacter sp. 226-4]|nr:prepilin-type N-terminal cleavage/methylation domain-containing protein [Acinetobacter sp. 226-1]MDM1769032.1 prepilin-type N-terminal cleavage/methylation domain-containing protein [Acinetobacter sp. 226-4]
MRKKRGFTLIELMFVIVIVAIIVAIAIPSYQQYMRRAEAAKVNQEMLRIAQELEKHKARNFSYVGFALGSTTYNIPNTSYTLLIVDGMATNPALNDSTATGQSWVMKANANDSYSKKFSFLLDSKGYKCKNTAFANISYSNCGVGGVNEW